MVLMFSLQSSVYPIYNSVMIIYNTIPELFEPFPTTRKRVSSVIEHSSTNPKVLGRFRARSHTGVMDYDEKRFMQLTSGVVHNFPKAVGV